MKLSSRPLLGSRMAVEVRCGDGNMTGVCMLCCHTSLLLLSSGKEGAKVLDKAPANLLHLTAQHFAKVNKIP